MSSPNTPRRICQLGLGVTLAISVEFNVVGTTLDTGSMAAMITNGALSLGSLLGAEIMCRAKVPARKRGHKVNKWDVVKFGGVGLATLLIMALTFVHGYTTMQHWGGSSFQSVVTPLAVDVMMILSGLLLLQQPPSRRRRKPKSSR